MGGGARDQRAAGAPQVSAPGRHSPAGADVNPKLGAIVAQHAGIQ